jgi:nitrogen fixation NifU-like protein
MMADFKKLYQELIIEHYRQPRNFRELDHANSQAEGHNPLCGDKLSVYMEIENCVVKDIGFVGSGCAIFIASASMMTESIKGKTIDEATSISKRFQALVSNSNESQPDSDTIGKLTVFAGVRGYSVRVKCALLSWKTMLAALEGRQETASTE